MTLSADKLALEIAKAVSKHDRGAITVSTPSCNDRLTVKENAFVS